MSKRLPLVLSVLTAARKRPCPHLRERACLYRCTKFENNCGIPVPATSRLMVCGLLEPIELAARYFYAGTCETCAKCYAERGQKKSTAALASRPRPREVATGWCMVVYVHLIQPAPGVSKQMGTFHQSTSPPGPCLVGKVTSIFGRVCHSCLEGWRPVSSWSFDQREL